MIVKLICILTKSILILYFFLDTNDKKNACKKRIPTGVEHCLCIYNVIYMIFIWHTVVLTKFALKVYVVVF